MRDQKERHVAFALNAEHELDDISTRGLIEIAGRFVGKQQLWAIGEGPREGHALLLTAGKLAWIMIAARREVHGGQPFRRAIECVGHAREFERDCYIFKRGHRRDQVEGLKENADLPAAKRGEIVFAKRV